jgi:transcriptional regulator with XRE-family HTH domain
MVKGETKGVRANGSKIKELRRKRALSQKALGREANVTERTLQRAEKGEVVMPEVLTAIATALKINVDGIIAEGVTRTETALPDDPHDVLVRLKRTSSASELSRTLILASDQVIDWEVDPDAATADKIAALIEIAQRWSADNADNYDDPADHMRDLGRANSLLADLNDAGIGLFVGSYQVFSVVTQRELKKVQLKSDTTKLIMFSNERGSQMTVRRRISSTEDEARQELEALVEQGYEVERDAVLF